MTITIEIPDAYRPNYGAIQSAIARRIGEDGGPDMQYPLTIYQTDCTTSDDNYTVVMADHLDEGEHWGACAVVRYKHRPFQPPPKPQDIYDDEERLRVMEDWEESKEQLQREEESAILHALFKAGHGMGYATPLSAHSPTGQNFANAPSFRLYGKHVLVQQYGGIDC